MTPRRLGKILARDREDAPPRDHAGLLRRSLEQEIEQPCETEQPSNAFGLLAIT